MRRLLFPTLITLPLLGSAVALVFALVAPELARFNLSLLLLVLAGMVYSVGCLKQLTTDWPVGIMFAAGRESEYRKHKKYAKRRKFDIVPNQPDDRLS